MLKSLFTLGIGLLTFTLNAQDTNSTILKIKDFSLRDYEAPDIKYKRLELGTNIDGSGSQMGKEVGTIYGGDINGGFSTYINNEGYQGRNYLNLRLDWNGSRRKDSLQSHSSASERVSLYYNSTNRMYVSERHFFAIHPHVAFSHVQGRSKRKIEPIENRGKDHGESVTVSVVLGVGTGRIQPIAPAREALNILISLQKYNRLSAVPDSMAIDSLARIANSIVYKRFFDSRYKRVYQLEELDKGLQDLGLVTNPDMVYAANLSDIWSFGMNYSRGAGTQWEMGLIPNIQYNYNKYELYHDLQSELQTQESSVLGGIGFLSWTQKTPLNFKLQSDISIRLSAGYLDSKKRNHSDYGNNSDTNTMVSEALKVFYSFGYYPNTRTGITINADAGLIANQIQKTTNLMKDEYIGLKTGIGLRGYYYVSPRFRVELNGTTNFVSDDYLNSSPISNGSQNLSGNNNFHYSYRLGINYALF